jgi:phenylacetate-CoA ligase
MKVKKVRLSPLKVYSRLRFYLKSQYWDRPTIERYQLRNVQNILLHAGANIPYYRDLFRSIRFDPRKFKSLADLPHIPLLEKENIRKDPERFLVDHRNSIRGYWQQTTGSTGTPLRLFIDRNGHINKYAATLRAYHWAGYSPGKRAFLLVDPDHLGKDYGYRLLSNSLIFDSRRVTRENVQRFYRLLKRFNPRYFVGYGRAFLHLYKHLEELGLEIPVPRSLVHYGENLRENDRLKLEEVYRTKVYDFYSHREDTVIAADPEPGKKYLMEDFFYPEILDQDGRVIPEGTGELVGTGFYNYTMPLIRYRTSDMVTLKGYNGSGRHKFTMVEGIEGRKNDKIITPGGRELYFVGDPLFDISGIIASQFIQEKIDHVNIKLLVDKEFSTGSIERIKRNYEAFIDEQMVFDVEIVDHLEERGRGKRPVIISRLG